MMDQLAGPLAKHSVTLFQLVYRRIVPPKFGYRIAPSDILEVISPFTYLGKVIELLGQPHQTFDTDEGRVLAYRFRNALLQINVKMESVVSVALVSLRLRWPNRFKVFPLGLQLGRDTFESVYKIKGETSRRFRTDNSSKFFTYSQKTWFGFPGRYFNFHFAAMEAATYPPIRMPEVKFERVEDFYSTLLEAKAKFNAVAITRDEDETFPFSWEYFS
ncbi:hypothetical protein [Achromobacter aloeverae]|uniref:Uncharacterized protein n=1 Tax=Achromobacter aloeverae TaxID=1750518 RepID=A0A4Q1HG91_9BURK|nr:hypothetical protein [Achromobacter aloeverae]RXN86092.1 hypothetical protein C7R54_20325 [Achromobacter aloeverae]